MAVEAAPPPWIGDPINRGLVGDPTGESAMERFRQALASQYAAAPAVPSARYAAAPAGYKSGIRRFGVAEANLPRDFGEGDYGGGGDLSTASAQPAAEPGLDPEQLRALLMMQQGGGLAGRLGAPSSLSGALTQGIQPGPAQPQPILQPQDYTMIGGPLPISRRLT